MKAIRVNAPGGPDVLKLEETADLTPGPGEVLVRVHAAGVNPVDTYIRSGNYGTLKVPYTPGMDAAGIVEAVGEGVKTVSPGTRVYTAGTLSGSYAELALCRESQVHPIPDHISFAQAAGINVPYATAYRALFHRARALAGETVLVHGASGGVGIAAVQIARAAGMIVVGSAGTADGEKLVRDQGAHHVLNHKSEDYLSAAVAEFTQGRGFDVVLEMLANVNLDADLDALAKGGRVVVIGSRGRVEIDPRKTMAKDSSILGMTLMNTSEDDARSIHAALGAGLRNGTLTPIVGKEFKLHEADQAHEAVMQPGAYGKIVLLPVH